MSSGSRPATAIARLPAIADSVAVVSCGGGDAPLADAGARHDPLVGRVDDALQLGVGQDALGRVHAPAGDADAAVGVHGSTSISGCFALTSAPLSAWMRVTRPATVALDLVEQLHRLDQADHLADA